MPDDRAPEDEIAPLSPWSVRHSLPHSLDDDDALPDTAPEDGLPAPRRSIFNRFRRNRTSPSVLQPRLSLPDEAADIPPTPEDELLPPPLEPARSPWRRPDEITPATVTASTAAPDAFVAPAVPTRPTPPIEAVLAASMATPLEEPIVEADPDLVAVTAETPRDVVVETPASVDEPQPAVAVNPQAEPGFVLPPAEPEPVVVASATPIEVHAEMLTEEPVEEPVTPFVADPVMTVVETLVAVVIEPPPPTIEEVGPEPERRVAPPTWPPAIAPSVDARTEDETRAPAQHEPDPERAPSRGWGALRPIPVPINPYMIVLSGLVTLVTLAYLLVEPSPRWYLVMGAIAVVGGLDGTLRATWRVTYRDAETTPALFMPAIFILAVPPLIEHNMRGFNVVPAGLLTGLAFFAIVAAQVGSARPGASYYPWARTVSTAGAYAAGFAFFSLTYVYDLGVGASALACGLVALMLAIEVLREGEIDSTETAGYAAAAGAAVGQWRLALHYLPVDGYLGGLAVVLGFLVVTGLLQAYITRSLDRRTTIDHAVIATAGAMLVVGARVAGLA